MFGRVCRSLLAASKGLLQVISAINGFAIVGISPFWWEVWSGAAWAQLCWRRIWHTSCTCVWFYLLDTPSAAWSIAFHRQPSQTWLWIEHWLRFYCNPLFMTWFKKKKKERKILCEKLLSNPIGMKICEKIMKKKSIQKI